MKKELDGFYLSKRLRYPGVIFAGIMTLLLTGFFCCHFVQGSEYSGEAMLKSPDHPVNMLVEKKIFIGDSNTEDMMNAVQDEGIWVCKVSMGYDWMVNEAVPAIEDEIEENTAVIIWMGSNDVYNISRYVTYVNQKAAEWAEKGAKTYYVSVGPVEYDPYLTNQEVEEFNEILQSSLSGVTYIDIYDFLNENGFATVDGCHYTDPVSVDIYNHIIENLQDKKNGIW